MTAIVGIYINFKYHTTHTNQWALVSSNKRAGELLGGLLALM
jgi:hypothetical protein